MTDIHQTGKVSFSHLDIVVPVRSPQTRLVIGALLMRIDPNINLFQILREWPSESESAETCLLHNVEGKAVYLFRKEENSMSAPADDNMVLETFSMQNGKKSSHPGCRTGIRTGRDVDAPRWPIQEEHCRSRRHSR